jgi:hypothetical protein
MVRSATILALVFVAGGTIAGASPQPCECGRREPPCSAYWTAAAVFVGRVDGVTRTPGGRTVAFSVRQSFRGVSSSTVDVTIGPAGQRCSLSLRSGQEYLVYAQRSEGTGGLTTSVCAGTREVSDAATDLSYVRSIQLANRAAAVESAPAGHIGGQVLLVPRTLTGANAGSARGLPGATIVMTCGSVSETVTTNEAGDFLFPSRGPGRFTVSVVAGDRYYSDELPAIVELRDARACAVVDRRLSDNGRIKGRVIDATGRPIPGLTIDLTTAIGAPSRRTITDRSGWYEFSRVPSGRFLIGVDISPRRTRAQRSLQLVHARTDKSASAKRVTLAAGSIVELADFTVPAHLRFVTISGVVLDADGLPAERARVYLKGAEDDDEILAEPATTDRAGRFLIAALADARYRLFAEGDRSDGMVRRVDSTDPIVVTVSDHINAVRLSLRRRY